MIMMGMMMTMMKYFLVAIALTLSNNPLLVAAQGAVVYQSTAVMHLNIEKSTIYTVDEIYNIEVETIQFLAEPLLMATVPNNVDILNTHVSVANQLQNDAGEPRIILDMVVEIIYIAAASPQQQNVVDISDILSNVVDPHQLAMALNVPSLSASYTPKDATVKLQSCDSSSSSNKSAADKGLIATTVFLAIGLGTLASVVLYVSGASCSACKSWFINCLFEEVVTGDGDDGYAEEEEVDFDDLDKNNNNKGSGDKCFQVHTYPDEESVSMSSVSLAMLTNPSGILGANHVDENSNPAAGLGIKTPGRGSSGDQHSELLETPMSQHQHQQPLGITSIRKMPLQQLQVPQQHHYYYHQNHPQQQQQQLQPSDASLQGGGGGSGEDQSNAGGLVNMIMQRLNLNENNNNNKP